MKTNVIMKRDLMGLSVRQNSKDGMFCANDINAIGNRHREALNLPIKQMGSYFNLDSTSELINAVCIEENISIEDVKKSKRGKNGGTWLHPIVFVDMAMWYSPELKVKILRWVMDGLLSSRNESGTSFLEMNKVVTKYFSKEFDCPLGYIRVANQIANACKVGSGADKWQVASEGQLKLRDKIQDNICLLADMSPNVGTCVSKSIAKALIHQRK